MSTSNVGEQKIGWKYKTPLQSDYLQTIIGGFSSEGLVTRPKITATYGQYYEATIGPFSMLVCPTDASKYDEENSVIAGDYGSVSETLVKISTTKSFTISIGNDDVAIGFEYSHKKDAESEGSYYTDQWYGDFKTLTLSSISNFKGIVVATIIHHEYTESEVLQHKISVTTQGADISDFLLQRECRNPECWLSLISPRRLKSKPTVIGDIEKYAFDKFELRSHNDMFTGYVNGHDGLVKFDVSKSIYSLPTVTKADTSIVPNDFGYFGHKYNMFKVTTDGLKICNQSDSLPISNTEGSVIGIVDSYKDLGYQTSFANATRIYTCVNESKNIYQTNNELHIE